MRRIGFVLLALAAVGASGCYHATVETGLEPSTQTLVKPFAPSWIYGLIPPDTIETMARCPDGVARVETRLSFVNQVVGFITFGIYTPMEITVTCASARAAHAEQGEQPDFLLAQGASDAEIRETMANAVGLALATHEPVLVAWGQE